MCSVRVKEMFLTRALLHTLLIITSFHETIRREDDKRELVKVLLNQLNLEKILFKHTKIVPVIVDWRNM